MRGAEKSKLCHMAQLASYWTSPGLDLGGWFVVAKQWGTKLQESWSLVYRVLAPSVLGLDVPPLLSPSSSPQSLPLPHLSHLPTHCCSAVRCVLCNEWRNGLKESNHKQSKNQINSRVKRHHMAKSNKTKSIAVKNVPSVILMWDILSAHPCRKVCVRTRQVCFWL